MALRRLNQELVKRQLSCFLTYNLSRRQALVLSPTRELATRLGDSSVTLVLESRVVHQDRVNFSLNLRRLLIFATQVVILDATLPYGNVHHVYDRSAFS